VVVLHEEHRVGGTPAALGGRLPHPGAVTARHRRRRPEGSGKRGPGRVSDISYIAVPELLAEVAMGSPGALQAVASTAVRLGHGGALTLGTDQPLSHQLSAPQLELTGRAGLLQPQVHTVAAGGREGGGTGKVSTVICRQLKFDCHI